MESQTPGPQSAPFQNPIPQNQAFQARRKRSFILWLSLALVVLILGGLYLLGSKVEKEPEIISGLEVAKRTAGFLDKTIRLDGSLIGGYFCGNYLSEVCAARELSIEQPHVGQAIYGYFILAGATGDVTYREKADRAINFVLDGCQRDVRMCEWNFFPLAQYYEKTGEERYLTQGMLPPAEGFLELSDDAVISGNVGHKLASLYKATNEDRFRDRLVEVAESQMGIELGRNRGRVSQDIQLAWSIYLPVYRITNDEKYLDKAHELFNNFKMSTELERFRSAETVPVGIKAADVLISLATLSENGDYYREEAKALLQDNLIYLWDTPANRMYNGDYGFIENGTKDPYAYKSTLQNGWLIKLFVLMGDEQFEASPRNEK